MRRLREAGFGREFVDRAILPEWWDHSCLHDPSLLPEIEIRVARFLSVPVSTVADPASALAVPPYPKARLRGVRQVDGKRLRPAIHAAINIARAVVRNLRPSVPGSALPRFDGLAWHEELQGARGRVALDAILDDLWNREIPVIPTHTLPAPGFQGLAAVVEGRPVVVLGDIHADPGTAAFRIAHAVGHIANGDCTADAPVVTGDHRTPTPATTALHPATGATAALRKCFTKFVDLGGACLTDRELMRMVVPDLPSSDAFLPPSPTWTTN